MPDNTNIALPPWFPSNLSELCITKTLKKNEPLFSLNENATHIFFVESGMIQALRLLPNGSSAIMQRASAGEFFAEAALCVDNYTCDAVTIHDAVVYCIPKQTLVENLQKKDDFSLNFAMLLAKNTRVQCSRVERLRIKRARDRVLHYLVCESSNEKIVCIQSSLAHLADELGLEPETLYRTLADLQKDKTISRNGKNITLK